MINEQLTNDFNKSNIKLGLKRKRELIGNTEEKIATIKKKDIIYETFLKENDLKFSEIIVPHKVIEDKKSNKNSKEKFEKFLKNKNLHFTGQSAKINDKINMINKAYSFNDIKFFSRKTLKMIEEYLELINNFQLDIFSFEKNKGNIKIITNVNLQKGTFITDITGYYCYRKTSSYEYENINGFEEIFLFKCHDKNYDRYLKNSLFINFGSIIAETIANENGNCP